MKYGPSDRICSRAIILGQAPVVGGKGVTYQTSDPHLIVMAE